MRTNHAFFRLLFLFWCLGSTGCTVGKGDVVPSDFRLVAYYGSGYSSKDPWQVTITADGKALQETYILPWHTPDHKEKIIKKTFSLTKEDLKQLATSVQESRFYSLAKDYPYGPLDSHTLILSVTMNGTSHGVRIYAPQHQKDKEAVTMFMKVWNEVLRKVPDPNPALAAAAQPVMALGTDTPEQIIDKLGCNACHKIPTIATARFGAIGPLLIEKTNASKRIASPGYQARAKAGKAHATTPKEYVIESIIDPSAYIVPGFVYKVNPEVSIMPRDYSKKFTPEALEKMADFLLTLDGKTAKKEGLIGPAPAMISQIAQIVSLSSEAKDSYACYQLSYVGPPAISKGRPNPTDHLPVAVALVPVIPRLNSGLILSRANPADRKRFWEMFQNDWAEWSQSAINRIQFRFTNLSTVVTYDMIGDSDLLSGNATIRFDFGASSTFNVTARRQECPRS